MLEAVLNKEIIVNKTLCRIIGISVFVILTALGAFVRIPLPFSPVPITLQTFFVLLSGAFLGSNLGAITQLSYISLGALGLPVFTNAGSGLLYLFGPTGGYLIGFVAVAFFVGWLAERGWDRRVWTAVPAMLAGETVLYVFGLLWLVHFVTVDKVLQVGLYPFVVGDLIKVAAAALILPSAWLLLRRFRN